MSIQLQRQNIPFIYQVLLPQAEELILENHNKICQDLSKTEKEKHIKKR